MGSVPASYLRSLHSLSSPTKSLSSPRQPEGACEHLSQVWSLLCPEPSMAPTLLGEKPKSSPQPTRPCATCPGISLRSLPPSLPQFPLLQPHAPWGLCMGCASASSPLPQAPAWLLPHLLCRTPQMPLGQGGPCCPPIFLVPQPGFPSTNFCHPLACQVSLMCFLASLPQGQESGPGTVPGTQ